MSGYSLGSPFATLEPRILPVVREILEGKQATLFPDCGTRALLYAGAELVFVVYT